MSFHESRPALPRLDDCLFPVTRRDAVAYLELAHSVCEYLTVYQMLFPKEHQRSLRAIGMHQEPLFPGPGDIYAPHEKVFLALVHTTLFPLDPNGIDEFFAIAEDRCSTVPVYPIGFDDLYFEQIAAGYEVSQGWLILLYLLGNVDDEWFPTLFCQFCPNPFASVAARVQAEAILAIPVERGQTPWLPLRELCAREAGPLRGLCGALQMLEHDTGNVWLDYTSEMPFDPVPWEAEAVQELARQYQLAVQLHEQAWACVLWLEHDPVAHFQEVVALWNRC